MKKLLIIMPILLCLLGTIEAQEVKKVEEKKVFIVTKKVDKNGKVIEERIQAEGKEADELLKKMKDSGEFQDIDIEVIQGDQVQVFKTKSTSTTTITTTESNSNIKDITVTKNDKGESTYTIKMNDPETGELKEMTWQVIGDEYPEDLKKLMEEENIEIHNRKSIMMDGDEEKEIEIEIESDGPDKGSFIIKLQKNKDGEPEIRTWNVEGGNAPTDVEELIQSGKIKIEFEDGDGKVSVLKMGKDKNDLREVSVRMGVRINDAAGLMVAGIEEGSPAGEAGLMKGDVITEIDDYFIKNYSSLMERLSNYKPGDKIKIRYIRDGKANLTSLKFTAKD